MVPTVTTRVTTAALNLLLRIFSRDPPFGGKAIYAELSKFRADYPMNRPPAPRSFSALADPRPRPPRATTSVTGAVFTLPRECIRSDRGSSGRTAGNARPIFRIDVPSPGMGPMIAGDNTQPSRLERAGDLAARAGSLQPTDPN